MRPGTGQSGATLAPAYRETGHPVLRRTCGLASSSSQSARTGGLNPALSNDLMEPAMVVVELWAGPFYFFARASVLEPPCLSATSNSDGTLRAGHGSHRGAKKLLHPLGGNPAPGPKNALKQGPPARDRVSTERPTSGQRRAGLLRAIPGWAIAAMGWWRKSAFSGSSAARLVGGRKIGRSTGFPRLRRCGRGDQGTHHRTFHKIRSSAIPRAIAMASASECPRMQALRRVRSVWAMLNMW